jgi:hypothetical protein
MSPLEIAILVAALLASTAYYIRERRRSHYDSSTDPGPGFADGHGPEFHRGHHDSHHGDCGDHGTDAGADCGGHDGGSH